MTQLRSFSTLAAFFASLIALGACSNSDGSGDATNNVSGDDPDAGENGSAEGANSDGTDPDVSDETEPEDGVTFGPTSPAVSVVEPETAPAPVEEPVVTDGPNAETPLTACAGAVAIGEDPLIDDFEDLNDTTLVVDNRDGGWYSYNDMNPNGQMLMEWLADPNPPVSGMGVMHVAGSGFAEYSGVGMGVRWTETGTEYCYYDASYYDGITFWARGDSAVRVALQNPAVRPIAEGGTCPADASCYDSHGFDIALTSEWTQFKLAFVGATQAGWGTPFGAFQPDQLFTIEFQFPPGGIYDVYLDDIAFYVDGEEPTPVEPEPMPEPSVDAGSTTPDPVDAGSPTVDPVEDLDAGVMNDAGL